MVPHPAPDRPGMSVNHITTPTITVAVGTNAQNVRLRIGSAFQFGAGSTRRGSAAWVRCIPWESAAGQGGFGRVSQASGGAELC